MRPRLLPRSLVPLFGLVLLAAPASAVTIDWVSVGNPDNDVDTASNCLGEFCGWVPNTYSIAQHEVTNAQYVEMLNAKAASDPFGLYNPDMSLQYGGITRSGSPGSYSYAVMPGFANRPVRYVSFYDALRFANWMNNGQGNASTETGAYTLIGGATPNNGTTVTRNPGATIFLPTENEWYKAAYYDGLSATYFDYPMGSNSLPNCTTPHAVANGANCGEIVLTQVTDVGAYPLSASPYGTFDQGGNVWEWNEQIVDGGTRRGWRGGAWNAYFVFLGASSALAAPSTNENGYLGFRLATVPEPGTIALVTTGLAALASKRRRTATA